MMKNELHEIIDNLNYKEFVIELEDDFFNFSYFYFIRVNNFDSLLKENHRLFNTTDSKKERKNILEDDLKIYQELSKYLKFLIRGIENKQVDIKLIFNLDYKSGIENAFNNIYKIDESLNFNEKVKYQTLKKLREQLKDTSNRIFELKNYEFPIYQKEKILGRNFYLRFAREIIIYKNVSIGNTSHYSSVLYKDDSQYNEVIDLINILAFLQASPNFLLSDSKFYNEKLTNLYSQFDILDLLTLSSNKFFKTSKEPFRSIATPILKLYRNTDYTIIPNGNHIELFHLYHSSLKQIEPLPRCVFLFRIIEYGKNYHYSPKFKPEKLEFKKVIEYYYSKVLEHTFIPLYFLDYGTTWNPEKDKMVRKRKTQYLNLLTELKRKSKEILKNWEKHHYLKSKSLGEIIYNTGRNTVAHGGNGNQNINYDYANKYKHINDVNIFLELIARYLIEIHNPELKKIVHKRKKIYEQHCSHMKMMKGGKTEAIKI